MKNKEPGASSLQFSYHGRHFDDFGAGPNNNSSTSGKHVQFVALQEVRDTVLIPINWTTKGPINNIFMLRQQETACAIGRRITVVIMTDHHLIVKALYWESFPRNEGNPLSKHGYLFILRVCFSLPQNGDYYIAKITIAGRPGQLYCSPAHMNKIAALVIQANEPT
ncbi:MAG: hypothetical protein HY665_09665 [Chloroflexi bacterium]|nr:hypothetical protein [Chloroflexota bacterium]